MKQQPEVHLFILWEKSLYQKDRIVKDIESNFLVLKKYSIVWDSDNFSENISRFYGQNLPSHSYKEAECGTGEFVLILVKDLNPKYEYRETSNKKQLVNTNTFDAKNKYRMWTKGGHKIHSTNTIHETKHDLYLLLEKKYDTVLKLNTSKKLNETPLNKNLAGAIQWNTTTDFFNTLNILVNYVVLRNFKGLPDKFDFRTHGDIDILTDMEAREVAYILGAKPVFKEKYRSHYKVNVENSTIRLDIRTTSDQYYCKSWSEDILKTRIYNNGIYIPNMENHLQSLIYHALVHKKNIPEDYQIFFKSKNIALFDLKNNLNNFMKKNNYVFCEPKDLSVHYNNFTLKKTTLKRKFHTHTSNLTQFIATKLSSKNKRLIKKILNLPY